jgi:hypothetical protein
MKNSGAKKSLGTMPLFAGYLSPLPPDSASTRGSVYPRKTKAVIPEAHYHLAFFNFIVNKKIARYLSIQGRRIDDTAQRPLVPASAF